MGPFIVQTQKSGLISYKWVSGRHGAEPPEGFDNYFGKKPLYRFFPFDVVEGLNVDRCRFDGYPNDEIARHDVRQPLQSRYGHQHTVNSVRDTVRYISEIIREDPDIQVRARTSLSGGLFY